MISFKQIKLADKRAAQQQQVIQELNALVKEIERCEAMIADLKSELETVNAKYQNRKTTQEDVDFLTDLLACAKKKLLWEKHLTRLRKRTPEVLEVMSRLLNDPHAPPSEQTRGKMLQALQAVQASMARLQGINLA
ncbi:MAG: hypothetical protein HZC54_15900 [Verrucomicrobia bacterium]|nr:hypothetical protein [Verrucomicrobiota bacterium]